MIKRFFQDSFLYTGAALFTKGLSFLLLPIYIRLLTKEEFGYTDYINALAAFVFVIAALEISQSVTRFIPDVKDNEDQRNRYIFTALNFTCLCYFIFVLLCFIFDSELAVWVFANPQDVGHIHLIAFYIAIAGIFEFILTVLRAELQSKSLVIVSTLNAVLVGAFTVFFLYNLELGLKGFFLGQIVGRVVAGILGFWLAKIPVVLSIDISILKRLLSFSLPLVPSSISVILVLYTDRLMVKELLDVEVLAVYAVAIKLASIVVLLMVGFQSALTPLIYNNYKDSTAPAEISRLFDIYLLGTAILFVLIVFFSEPLVMLVGGDEYLEATTPLMILVVASISSSFYLFSPGLSIAKKTLTIAGISIFTAVLNVGLNYYLIDIFGMLGAAWATFISISVSAWLTYWFARKLYVIPLNPMSVIGFYSIVAAVMYTNLASN